MQIRLDHLKKEYRDCTALEDVSLVIEEGELIALIGPSGSGKTTLLKIIAGLETPTQGQIYINDKNVTNLELKDREIGFVFQHYALFKHMNVYENIAFAYKVKPRKIRLSKEDIEDKVHELAKLVQIENLLHRHPHELSGGQRQRVALARALAVKPKILLLDEPFAALDAKLKLQLRRWLRKLQKNSNITIILVTHDQEEALDIADRVLVLHNGSVEQIDTPKEVYHSPSNSFVYNFIGHYNVFKAAKDSNGKISILNKETSKMIKQDKWYNKHKIVSNIASLFNSSKVEQPSNQKFEEYFEVFVRPHDVEINTKPLNEECISANITHINLAAPFVRLELESPEYELIQAEMSHESFAKLAIKKNDLVYVKPKQVTMFTE
jgi:sulfate/thiosulfate transport system ATP-binding protein